MDLVKDNKEQIFEEKEQEIITLTQPLVPTIFRTSIWDETLYKVYLYHYMFNFSRLGLQSFIH